jgi:Domain of unknown function (DUF4272)
VRYNQDGRPSNLAQGALRSDAAGHSVPYLATLPCIESEATCTLRTPSEIATRLLALICVAVKGEGLEQAELIKFIDARGASNLFSPEERAFIDERAPSPQDMMQYSWRYEAAWVLAWALHLLEEPLAMPTAICDVPRLVLMVRDTPDLAARGTRPLPDILDATDLIYRIHWAVRQAALDGAVPPASLEPGVVMERHKALNWLIGYNDNAAWDDVGTDT